MGEASVQGVAWLSVVCAGIMGKRNLAPHKNRGTLFHLSSRAMEGVWLNGDDRAPVGGEVAQERGGHALAVDDHAAHRARPGRAL